MAGLSERTESRSGRAGAWIGFILAAGAVLALAIAGLWIFMSTTATVLHPDAEKSPSVPDFTPRAKWNAAVEQARKAVRASLAGENLPGLSVAVGMDGGIVWAEGFGFADLEKQAPVTPGDRFRIGTASIALTSAGAGVLVESGRLKLDDPIRTYVPEFPEQQWPVTLGQVMGHVAGIRNDGGDESALYSQHCERPVEALAHFAEGKLLFEPGTRFSYSRYGWIVVSAAIEAAAKKPILAFMKEQVFAPLGMQDTVPDTGTAPMPEGVTHCFPRFAADPKYGLHLMRPLDFSCYAGSSVFVSTPSDLVRFGLGINSGKLLKPATVQLLQASQRLAAGAETGYGLGWDNEEITLAGKRTLVVGHHGDLLGGMAATLWTVPERGMVVAVTSNISYADTAGLAARIAEAFAPGQGSRQ